MNEWQEWRTRLLRGHVIDLVRLGTRIRCSECSPSLTRCSYDRRCGGCLFLNLDDKNFLNPKQKKKIAFINREFHSSADSVNVYVVFVQPAPALARPSNVPPPPETMDPYDAARSAVEKCERMIRVDLASKTAKDPGEHSGMADANPKLNVFVGNLDFGCKEEDLRVLFEGVVSGERGPPGDDEEAQKVKTWVTRIY